MSITIELIKNIEPHPTANNPMDLVTVESGKTNIANREGENPRDKIGDEVIVITPGYLLPQWLLEHNGLWNSEKNKGYLKGSKGNRTCEKTIADITSEVMLVRINKISDTEYQITETNKIFSCDENLQDFLEITKWNP